MVPADAPLIAELAARSFQTSRFHRDVRISKDLADEIKRQWGKNLATGIRRSESYVCLDVNKSIVGFISLVPMPPGTSSAAYAIDLIAVDGAHQQTGVGSFLVNHAKIITGKKSATLIAGTQASNKAAIKLYQRNGMKLQSASYVVHAHVPDD
jgi:ribosomal protein S18 acetylase RimI-like enzyme